MLRALLYILPLALTIFAFIDCLNTPEDEAKHLPKIAWVFIILLFWIVGPIVWLVAGKTRQAPAGGLGPSRGRRSGWVAPDDNPDFLKSLKDEKPGKAEKPGTAGTEPEKPEPEAGTTEAGSGKAEGGRTESALRDWEADLRRREEEIKRRESGSGPEDPAPPAAS
ncbi:PLD nuclease N-terminal domain-containing protein [Streptomyces sp. NPDC006296]|uniref:PLD nuclease N-terminal domain-containing protein n=1 Tax=Streptomyces sp. NPDC006296 TaxID=3156746 RepID=UPI0033B93345